MNPITVNPTVSQTEKPDAVNQCSIMYTVTGPGAPATGEDPYAASAFAIQDLISLSSLMGYVRCTKISYLPPYSPLGFLL
ncbi:27748_t:CDS:2 [Dentiscutata erythropus]|uniref:27748_t:CDS:1 n=1 Tax=Dentiscutata erythropus TaxID=1348616 RepID=A0A9N9N5C8_9GLOM|nr:27748_t:CDS:2 [Dentiscutata erythropus]